MTESGELVPRKKGIALKKEEFEMLNSLFGLLSEDMKLGKKEEKKIEATGPLFACTTKPTVNVQGGGEGEDIIPVEKLCTPKSGVYASCDYYPDPAESPMKKHMRYFNKIH